MDAMRRTLIALLAAGCGTGVLAGCGGDEPPAPEAAASPAPTATATATATAVREAPERRRYETLGQAVAAVERRVDVPVVVPRNLPDELEYATAGTRRNGGYIAFSAPGRRVLHIQYGEAGFDGCGPLHPRATTVGDVPAIVNASGREVTLVWPATLKRTTGRYGLSGPFPQARMMRFAESMQAQGRAAARARRPRGC